MRIDPRFAGATALAVALISPALAQAASDPRGVWLNDTGRGAIEIKDCGQGLCGHVVWVKDPTDTNGCGRQIIGDAQPVSTGLWDNGWIYSPEKKKRYDVELKPMDSGKLRVKGYAGSKFFSKTMIWTKAPTDLARCGQSATAPPAAPAGQASTPATAAPAAGAIATAPAEATPPPAPSAATTETSGETDVAHADDAGTDDVAADEGHGEGDRLGGLNLKELNLGDIDIDKFLTRTASGRCKLDLPWVKLDFECEK